MSQSSHNKPVRDWLLDKYSKAVGNLREQAIQIEVLQQQLREATFGPSAELVGCRNEIARLQDKVFHLSLAKNIKVFVTQNGRRFEVPTVATSSSPDGIEITVNGEYTPPEIEDPDAEFIV